MRYGLIFVVFLTTLSGSTAATMEGTVTEMTTDTITILQGGIKTQTFFVADELLTNTFAGRRLSGDSSPFLSVKKGCKVSLQSGMVNGRLLCWSIAFQPPDDTGIVTEIGKDTVTIRNDQEKSTKYKVMKHLADNSFAGNYGTNYPSRFGQVKLGCRVEVQYYKDKETHDLVICGFDVKVEKEKEK